MTEGSSSTGPRARALTALRRRGSLTIDELAQTLGLSKTATRAHVLRLEDAGLIARTESSAAGPGRPSVRVSLTSRGSDTFPTEDAALLARLLEFLARAEREDLIREFFEEIWTTRRRTLVEALGTGGLSESPLRDRLARLRTLLEQSHFMPQIATRTGPGGAVRVTVRECNCPLPEAVRATKLPCQLEARFLAEVVGGRPTKTRIASSRMETCDFEFIVDEPTAGA